MPYDTPHWHDLVVDGRTYVKRLWKPYTLNPSWVRRRSKNMAAANLLNIDLTDVRPYYVRVKDFVHVCSDFKEYESTYRDDDVLILEKGNEVYMKELKDLKKKCERIVVEVPSWCIDKNYPIVSREYYRDAYFPIGSCEDTFVLPFVDMKDCRSPYITAFLLYGDGGSVFRSCTHFYATAGRAFELYAVLRGEKKYRLHSGADWSRIGRHGNKRFPTRQLFGYYPCEYITCEERESAYLELVGHTWSFANPDPVHPGEEVPRKIDDVRRMYLIQAAYPIVFMRLYLEAIARAWHGKNISREVLEEAVKWTPQWQRDRYTGNRLSDTMEGLLVNTQMSCVIKGSPLSLENQAATVIAAELRTADDVSFLPLPEHYKERLWKGFYAYQFM